MSYARAEHFADKFFRGVTLRRGGVPRRLPKTSPGGPKLPLPGPMAVLNALEQVTQNTPAQEGTMNPFDPHYWEPGNEERFNASTARERAIEPAEDERKAAERELEFARAKATSDWVQGISQQGAEGGPGSDRE